MPVALGQYEDDLDVGQILQILRRRWLVIGGVTLAVSGAIWSWTLTRTPIFQGEFRVLIESVDNANPSQELLLGDATSSSTVDYDTQIEVLKSPVLLEPIARALQPDYPDVTYSNLINNLSISRLRETKVLSVSYRHPNAQTIQDVLEEVSQQYLEYSFQQRQSSLQQGIQFVDDQLPELRDRVTALQVRLERFRQQYSILDPSTRGNEISSLLASVEAQRQALQAELAQAQSLYQTLQGQLKTTPEIALSDAALSESNRYQVLLDQIQELEAEIAVASARYQDDSPQLLALREQRDNLRPLLEAESARILGERFSQPGGQASGRLTETALELNRELISAANNVQMLQARNRTLARIESDIKEEFDLVPGLARQYTDLQRELNIATESLNRFLATRENLQIDAAQKSVPWQLISAPVVPTVPISPDIPRNLTMGVIAGLLMGSVAALLTEKLDQVFHSPDELKQAIPLPLLGIIPYLPEIQQQTRRLQMSAQFQRNGNSASMLGSGASQEDYGIDPGETIQASMFLEAFRSLYTNVKFLGTENPIQSIVVSSSIPGEGKTTSALYLARAAAILGQRVLLVDADLRSPKHHIQLNLTNIRGLSSAISESLDVMSMIQRSPMEPNLSVLTAGPKPPDPVKLLSSKRMQSLVRELNQHYDLVVYDMPPLLGFSDSSVLAAQTDGMILVVGLGKTERSALNQALDALKLSPVSILGVVANGIKSYTTPSHSNNSYYRYYSNRQNRQRVQAAQPVSLHSNERRNRAVSPAQAARDRLSNSVDASSAAYDSPHSVDDTSFPTGHPSSTDHSDVDYVYDQQTGSSEAYANGNYADYAHDGESYAGEPQGDEVPPVAMVEPTFSPWRSLQPWQWAFAGVAALALSSIVGWMLYSRVINSATDPQPPVSRPDTRPTQPTTPSADPFADAVQLAQEALDATQTATTAQDWSKIAKLWQEASALMANVPESDSRFGQARERTAIYRSNGEYARQRVLQLLQEAS